MNKSTIRNNLLKCMEYVGIYIEAVDDNDILLENYIEDSVQFITLIVKIEEVFDIEIPDELLVFSNFETIDKTCEMLGSIVLQ